MMQATPADVADHEETTAMSDLPQTATDTPTATTPSTGAECR